MLYWTEFSGQIHSFVFYRYMANPSNSGNDVFDMRRVKRLVELMQENELTELDIQQGDMRIQLKRHAPAVTFPLAQNIPAPALFPAAMPTAMPVAAASSAAPVVPPTPPTEDKNTQLIKSPMVGTFYVSSSPDAPPFVSVGDVVGPEKTVCLIEAMKVYNEIQAECSGKILAVLATNGQTVEFGTPLFRVSE